MSDQNSSYVNYYERGYGTFKNIQALTSLIGIIANTLAIFVFKRKQLKKHSYSIYWKMKAFSDSFLLLHTFRHWAKYFLKVDFEIISPIFCHFNDYQPYVAGTISIHMECLITLDRLFTIIYPNRFKIIKQKRFQIAIISLVVIYSLLVCIRLPLNYRLEKISGTWICHVSLDMLQFNWIVYFLNVITVNIVINPFLDFKIISYIIRSRGSIKAYRSNNIDRKFAVSAIALNIMSMIIKVPYVFGNLVSMNLDYEHSEMIFSIGMSLTLLSNSDMFFINIAVNSMFRREFFSMIGIKRKLGGFPNGTTSSPNIISRRRFALSVEETVTF